MTRSAARMCGRGSPCSPRSPRRGRPSPGGGCIKARSTGRRSTCSCRPWSERGRYRPTGRSRTWRRRHARRSCTRRGSSPNERYDEAVRELVERWSADGEFQASLAEFAGSVVPAGRVKALAQKVVQLTMPGVPDLFQGSELWDLSLVDPDNRREVDYELRRDVLASLADRGLPMPFDPGGDDIGRCKLWAVRQALAVRRRNAEAFGPGSGYQPLAAAGPAADHALAFARLAPDGAPLAVTVVERLAPAGGAGGWAGTSLAVPAGRWVDVMTGAEHRRHGGIAASRRAAGRVPGRAAGAGRHHSLDAIGNGKRQLLRRVRRAGSLDAIGNGKRQLLRRVCALEDGDRAGGGLTAAPATRLDEPGSAVGSAVESSNAQVAPKRGFGNGERHVLVVAVEQQDERVVAYLLAMRTAVVEALPVEEQADDPVVGLVPLGAGHRHAVGAEPPGVREAVVVAGLAGQERRAPEHRRGRAAGRSAAG